MEVLLTIFSETSWDESISLTMPSFSSVVTLAGWTFALAGMVSPDRLPLRDRASGGRADPGPADRPLGGGQHGGAAHVGGGCIAPRAAPARPEPYPGEAGIGQRAQLPVGDADDEASAVLAAGVAELRAQVPHPLYRFVEQVQHHATVSCRPAEVRTSQPSLVTRMSSSMRTPPSPGM